MIREKCVRCDVYIEAENVRLWNQYALLHLRLFHKPVSS